MYYYFSLFAGGFFVLASLGSPVMAFLPGVWQPTASKFRAMLVVGSFLELLVGGWFLAQALGYI